MSVPAPTLSLPHSSFSALPAPSFPAPRPVPPFPPVRVRGGRFRLGRAGPVRRWVLTACCVPAVAVLLGTATGGGGPEPGQGHGSPAGAATVAAERPTRPVELRRTPVRIADPAAVRLLRPGDRVDVVAAGGSGSRLIAAGARVARVPEPRAGEAAEREGALVVLSVPRATAVRLAGAGETARLAVALC
ncbi:hypothetical protein [Streptomyces sp. NPDC060194]|uniref:hypothetical protein n=1 Tax=Streptomyces sp. NPDC060194 TaxID=3347069 RepID=UPI00365948D7